MTRLTKKQVARIAYGEELVRIERDRHMREIISEIKSYERKVKK